MRRSGRALALASWTAGLIVVARVLLAAGAESLSIPLTSIDGVAAWMSDTAPPEMAMAVVRLLALAATFYLLAVTALGVVARAARLGVLAAAVDRVTPRLVHRLVSGGSGLGLVLGGALGALAAPALGLHDRPALVTAAPGRAAPSDSAGTATMHRLPDPTAAMTRSEAPPPTATMTRATAGPAPRRTSPTSAPSAPSAPTPPAATTSLPATPALADVDGGTWVVEPGDSFWSIAEDVLAPSGASLDERAVNRYWRHLVDANRAVLADRGNPDLLVPGQRLVVPPPAP